MRKDWRQAIVRLGSNIEQAILNLNSSALKIILVVDHDDSFQGTITDGDIRRAFISGATMLDSIDRIINKNAITLGPDVDQSTVKFLMLEKSIHQIPIISHSRKLVGLYLWDEINEITYQNSLFLIMAGGYGMRMRPLTENCPKPMLHIANKPILEHIILRAKAQGFSRFAISVNYLREKIKKYFGDGMKFGVSIEYLEEDIPLGTAGAIGMLKEIPNQPIVVMNGDIYTDLNFKLLLDFHHVNSADATMVVRVHEWQSPYGEVDIDGLRIVGFKEKPIISSYINTGIYVIAPEAIGYLTNKDHCDMPQFFELIQSKGKNVIAYKMNDRWMDIGRPEDLNNAFI